MSSSWLHHFDGAAPGSPRVLCLPHAGGTAHVFLPLARALAPHVEVVAVQYPGRHERRLETPIADLPSLAAALAPHVEAMPGAAPVLYLGHSMGALVATELIGRVTHPPRVLVASACLSPNRAHARREVLESDQALLEEILALGATSRAVVEDPDLRAMVLPPLRADYGALYAYRPGSVVSLGVPVAAFVGRDDPRVSVDDARAWAAHTGAAFVLQVFDGDHFYIGPEADDVAGRVVELLARFRGGERIRSS